MPPLDSFNIFAVVVAAAAAFALGALWYSPILFGKKWVEVHGYSQEQITEMRKTANQAYLLSVLCFLLMALALSVLVYYTGLVTVAQGLKLGALVWLGFAFTIGLMGNRFTNKPISVFVIDGGYQLAYLLIMGVILAVWR